MCFRPAAIQKPINCPKCGKTNLPDSKVCRDCGAEITAKKDTKK